MHPAKIYIAAADNALGQEMQRILVSHGFDVCLFGRGYDVAALTDDWPDLFLIDIRLPDINGFEICSWLKSHPSSSHIPVILMAEDSYLRLLAPSCHADDFLETPTTPSHMIDKINDWLAVIRTDRR